MGKIIKQGESYLQTRLNEAGIKPEDNMFRIWFQDEPTRRKDLLFSEDKSHNLLIRYIDLKGEQVYYDQKGNLKEFFRIRFKNPTSNMKYFQPKGTEMHMYWTPSIIHKYQQKEKIQTLFITEGEIKAFVGHLHGLNIAGIGGIHNFSNKSTNRLLPELEQLISTCSIRNIVLLFDADCLTVTYENDKDLYTRPNSFYSAIRRFKELTTHLNIDVYFSHILQKYEQEAKGIDDLINHKDTNIDLLIDELHLLSAGNKKEYVHTISISENSISTLRKYFGLDSAKSFYTKYSSILQEQTFVFKGSLYRHDGDKLILEKHKDSDLFVRIGCDYFKRISKINTRGDIEGILKKWKITEIKRDYKYNFIKQIEKYDEFCNIPDNTENYKRVFTLNDAIKNYNLYEPLNHKISEGEFRNTELFLRHLFRSNNHKDDNSSSGSSSGSSSEYGDPYTVALDYLTLIYQKPQQLLPILCLVSKEQGTGKTTFLKWLKAIYQSNATILGNAEFKMDFNTHYISKLLIMIDESFIELDKRSEKERIKKLATSTTQFYHPKGIDTTEIDYFGKLIMCSNNENNFIQLEKSDIRFFVVKVLPFEREDPDFFEKLVKEIPAFLFYLRNREIIHPKSTRAWFATEHLITNQFKEIVKHTRGRLENDIREYIEDILLTHSLPSYKVDATRLTKAVNEQSKYKHSVADVRTFLKTDCNLTPLKPQRYKIPTSVPNPNGNDQLSVYWDDANGRPYEFLKEDWVDEEEAIESDELPF